MAKKSDASSKSEGSQERVVAENRKARHRFEILERLECGVALVGTEVKSMRNGKVSLDEAYARVKDREVWLVGCDIPEYKQAGVWNHPPKRPRKLLMHRRELEKFADKATQKGLTLVPLRMYFNARGIAKVELGLCKGKKLHDKREDLKKRDARRDVERAMRRR
jgi:SsrA-binding protein